MMYRPGMRDFLVSGLRRISHHRTDGWRDNTETLNELEERGGGRWAGGYFVPGDGKGVRGKWEKVEETQPVVREEQEVDGWVWRSMRGALCEEIRGCECACDGRR